MIRSTRWTLAALLVGAVTVPQPAAAGEGTAKEDAKKEGAKKDAEKTFKQVAHVKVEIKQTSGKIIKSDGTVDWGADGRIELPGDDHLHAVLVKVERDPDAQNKLFVTLGYDQDGEAVIAPYGFDTTVKTREVIEIEGGVAIALVVTPKQVAVDAPPPESKPTEREDKLEIGGDNEDPLGGLK